MQLAIVAAGFTPGEADQLRRSMAAWKKKGSLEHFHARLIQGMRERGYTRTFAEQIYQYCCVPPQENAKACAAPTRQPPIIPRPCNPSMSSDDKPSTAASTSAVFDPSTGAAFGGSVALPP